LKKDYGRNPYWTSSHFRGSTGGLLTKALVEEKYAITWTSPKEQVFEMPNGGAAVMRQGDNLLYLLVKNTASL
jgi:photosystem I subunit 2